MLRFFLLLVLLATTQRIAIADVTLTSAEKAPFDVKPIALATVSQQHLNAVSERDPSGEVALRLTIDGALYYIKPMLFMLKKNADEVCTFDFKNSDSYRCVEGQPNVQGCHLMFFDAQGKWVGFHTMQIKEGFPHYCNAMPAVGIANKSRNELLVTMQYFLIDGANAKEISEIGSGWFRMTSLFRVKAVNGKIEVEQDDTCLGNPNRIDNIPEARKRLRQCSATK